MSDILIREACPDDASQMMNYLKQIGGETDNLTFGAEGLPITLEDEKDYIRMVHDDPHSVMYVAIKDGKIVGDGSLRGLPRRMRHRAEVGLSVIRDEWNRGIGSALLQRLIEYAKAYGIEILNLEVREDNINAIHLYEKFGFRKIGVSPAFFKMGNEYVNFVLMYLDLR